MDDFAYQWPYMSMTQPRETGIDGLNALSALSAQFETLSRKLDALVVESTQGITVTCDYCADNHPSHQCTVSFEPVHYGGDYRNNYAYPDYHQDLGYHPDSTWSYNYDDQYYAPSPAFAPEFSCQPPIQEERMSNFEEIVTKIMTSNEEMLKSQDISIQNLQNQIDQMFKALNNCPQNNWCNDMDSETYGEPNPNLQLDEPQDVESGETSGEQEKEAEDPTLSSNDDEPIVLILQVPSPPKFKNPVSFAKPCPLGSHFLGKAICDDGASMNVEPWWAEEMKIEEEPVVLDKPQCPNLITDTTDEAPSFLAFEIENLSTKSKLGDFNSMTIANGNLPKATWLLMDGGFLNYRRGIG